MDRSRLIAAARGDEAADTVFTNASVVNVFSGDIESADVALAEGHIAGVGEYSDTPAKRRIDLSGKFIAPAYTDAHIHLESTMLLPSEFARVVLPHGSTCVVSDPHEIANVMGLPGILLLMGLAKDIPFDFYFTLSSCVPATHLETSGASLPACDLRVLIDHDRIVGLAEMMNFPGVYLRDPDVLAKLELARKRGKVIDGHAPLVSGRDLNAYIAGGTESDHECTRIDEAREKLSRGMWIFLREGSTERNLADLLPLINDATASRCCLVTDDRQPDELIELGHINYAVHKAVSLGINPVTAIRLATINPANYFGFRERGAVAPGRIADLQILSDLDEGLLHPLAVYKSGERVAENGSLVTELNAHSVPVQSLQTVRLPCELTEEAFAIRGQGGRVRVIKVVPHQIVTDAITVEMAAHEGGIVPDVYRDILKLAVIERYSGKAGHSAGFVQGFGIKAGAIASSVAHDSHNLIVVGANDHDMTVAVNRLARTEGGLVAVKDGTVIADVPLPLAGLISLEDAPTVAARLETLMQAVRDELGCTLANPFMTLSFLALPVIPHLKLTDKGLVDVGKFDFVPLFAE